MTQNLTVFYQECDLNIDDRKEQLESIGENILHYLNPSDIDLSADENRDAIISGVQDSLRASRSQRSDILESPKSQSSSRLEPSFEASEGGHTRIRSFAGESPKVEVDISSVEISQSKKKSSTSPSREFTGKSTDQNVSSPVLKYKIKKNKSERNSATQSYFKNNPSNSDTFDEIDEDSKRFPLTPVERYE